MWLKSHTHTHTLFYLCPKNNTALACYDIDVHKPILIIFGRNVAKNMSSQMVLLYFHTSPSQCFCYANIWGNDSRKLRLFT